MAGWRSVAATCAVALSALLAPPAGATITNLSVNQVQVGADGRHEVWVSVLDAEGAPVAGLISSDFSVREDGRAVDDLRVESFSRRYAGADWSVLVDPGLTQGRTAEDIADLLKQLGSVIGDRDVVRVMTLATRPRTAEAPVSKIQSLVARFPTLAGDERGASLYDGLFAGVRRAARVPVDRGSLALVATRGEDTEGHHGAVDVLALARARSRVVPVSIVLIDPRMNSTEGERLGGLAARSGGAYLRVQELGELTPAVLQMAQRMRGIYILRFGVSGWQASRGHHVLTLAAEQGGERREVEREFDAADVSLAPWWRQPLPWVWLVLIAVGAPAAGLALRPRRICRLVVEGGEERGCWFELYALPVSLGAAQSNDLVFPDALVSRNHAVLERRERSIEVTDLNSENGTFVNGEPVGRRRLEDGDRLSLGGGADLIFRTRG